MLCQWHSRLELRNSQNFHFQMSKLARKSGNLSMSDFHLETYLKTIFLEELSLKSPKGSLKLTIQPPPGFSFPRKTIANELDLKLQRHISKLVNFFKIFF